MGIYTLSPWERLQPDVTYDAWLDEYTDLDNYVTDYASVTSVMEEIEYVTGNEFEITDEEHFAEYMEWKYNLNVYSITHYYFKGHK